jgi:DnaK suppressor protein
MATKKTVSKKASKKVTKKVTKAVTKKTSAKASKAVTKKITKKATTKKVLSTADNGLVHGIAPYKEKAREKYMNAQQVEHFRTILVAWKRSLLEEVSRTIHLMQDENINHPDPNDRASQETDMSLELRSRDRERKLLKKIDSTISKLDDDDYGWCERCGIEIGVRRLEARPTADLCVDCKTLNEIKERQMI